MTFTTAKYACIISRETAQNSSGNGGVASRQPRAFSLYISIGFKTSVLCREIIPISEGPSSEVPLYKASFANSTTYPLSLSFLSIHCSISSVICRRLQWLLISETMETSLSMSQSSTHCIIDTPLTSVVIVTYAPHLYNMYIQFHFTVVVCSVLMRMCPQYSGGGGRSLGTSGAWHVR